MISFFGSVVTFDFVTNIPTTEIIQGSLIFSTVTMMLSAGYELRRYGEGRRI